MTILFYVLTRHFRSAFLSLHCRHRLDFSTARHLVAFNRGTDRNEKSRSSLRVK